jgi:hypothetical protein
MDINLTKWIIINVIIGIFFLNSCSTTQEADFSNKKIPIEKYNLYPKNDNIRMISETSIESNSARLKDSIKEYCINGELIVFLTSMRGVGAVKMEDSSKCINY